MMQYVSYRVATRDEILNDRRDLQRSFKCFKKVLPGVFDSSHRNSRELDGNRFQTFGRNYYRLRSQQLTDNNSCVSSKVNGLDNEEIVNKTIQKSI